MGLKRKASFTASPNTTPTPVFPGAIPTTNETSTYLPSRTRKRFRDNRPDEQTIYGERYPVLELLKGMARIEYVLTGNH